jgi:hypothetical protein
MPSGSTLFEARELKDIRSVAFVVLDSLRWDSFQQACKPVLNRWAPKQTKRFSYASWTQPSHSCLLSGLLPHESAAGRLAATTYISNFSLWGQVLGGQEDAQQHLYPEFCLPLMARRCGWHTIGRVAMPILNEDTSFSQGFDDYALSPLGGNLGTQIESISLSLITDKNFVFINAGETHYPYLMPKAIMPRISGVHGVVGSRLLNQNEQASPIPEGIPFTMEDMVAMHKSQIHATELADRYIEQLLEILPKPILLLVVSDHGELFGEDGFFGHGPFFHQILFEVPLAAGVVK